MTNTRQSRYAIDPQFLERWSPRSFSAEPIEFEELMTIFEAARWAPSSFNSQPWRFLYAMRATAHFDRFVDLLMPFNQLWAKDASALVVLISKTTMRPPVADEDVPSYTHSLDAGAASGFLALQANKLGWHVHGIAGFDKERAVAELAIPADFRVEAVYAVGRKDDPAKLPEVLRGREFASDRRPLNELAFEGSYPIEPDDKP